MPVVVMPADNALRLQSRIVLLSEGVDVRMFAADTVVAGIGFSPDELAECGANDARAIVLAVEDLSDLTEAIGEVEDGTRNYFQVTNDAAVARLDPFAGLDR